MRACFLSTDMCSGTYKKEQVRDTKATHNNCMLIIK